MALKPCKECNLDVSTKAFSCPSCGASNPTFDKRKTVRDFLITLLGLGALIIFPFIGSNHISNNSTQEIARPPNAKSQKALQQIKSLSWVKDAVYLDYATIKWQIGMRGNGKNAAIAAQSICELLQQHGLVNQATNVRMVDIRKVMKGQNFREASLGLLNCETGKKKHP